MSYQVLARKYRPKQLSEVRGHVGVRRVLSNTLKEKKVHHAYLLTGTRGIGKTSLARLFAKCLSCAKGITETPCEQCANCIAIQKNQFIDLIEVDGASRTRVEDMQSLLENVQYRPVLGRYKIYLIDEVHMLSMHSFNALLKTLEEPPDHVIFLLATTDVQRVNDTIISRCLQLNLKTLGIEEITQQLISILDQEKIQYEIAPLQKIAKLAKGSVRDALSLLEPVILHNNANEVTLKDIEAIYGDIDPTDPLHLISLIHQKKVKPLLAFIQKIATKSIDFEHVLDELLENLYQIAVTQQIEEKTNQEMNNIPDLVNVKALANNIKPEEIQLYYQIALISKKDLSLAPTPQLGFQMAMLRMIAFTPLLSSENSVVDSSLVSSAESTLDWVNIIPQLLLTGFLKSFALHCTLKEYKSDSIHLSLDPNQKVLYSQEREDALKTALSQFLKKDIKLYIEIGSTDLVTPAALISQQETQKRQIIYQKALKEPGITMIQKKFDATIISDNIHIDTK